MRPQTEAKGGLTLEKAKKSTVLRQNKDVVSIKQSKE